MPVFNRAVPAIAHGRGPLSQSTWSKTALHSHTRVGSRNTCNPEQEAGKARGEMLMKSRISAWSYGVSHRISVMRENSKHTVKKLDNPLTAWSNFTHKGQMDIQCPWL